METKQIGTLDIVVTLYIAPDFTDRDDKGVFLEKRWDLERSPFWKFWIHSKPSSEHISFPYYPHTGDTSRVITMPSLECHLEITSTRTTQNLNAIFIQAICGQIYRESNGDFEKIQISTNDLVKALLDDRWRYVG